MAATSRRKSIPRIRLCPEVASSRGFGTNRGTPSACCNGIVLAAVRRVRPVVAVVDWGRRSRSDHAASGTTPLP